MPHSTQLYPQLLLSAYAQGVFPMAHENEGGAIYWYDPNPRAILPLEEFHTPRSLLRVIKKNKFQIRYDADFEAVIRACAAPTRDGVWISEEIIRAYCVLHELGYAHSVESWRDGKLVGGLYGVTLGGLFAGESMFSHVTDASKVALYYLVRHLRPRDFQLLDIQFMTDHLRRFGAVEISRDEYQQRLARALTIDARF